MRSRRRQLLKVLAMPLSVPGLSGPASAAALPSPASPTWDIVESGTVLRFPQDHGAHPGFRTEWWYVTGWLQRDGAADAGPLRPGADSRRASTLSS